MPLVSDDRAMHESPQISEKYRVYQIIFHNMPTILLFCKENLIQEYLLTRRFPNYSSLKVFVFGASQNYFVVPEFHCFVPKYL